MSQVGYYAGVGSEPITRLVTECLRLRRLQPGFPFGYVGAGSRRWTKRIGFAGAPVNGLGGGDLVGVVNRRSLLDRTRRWIRILWMTTACLAGLILVQAQLGFDEVTDPPAQAFAWLLLPVVFLR